MPQKQFIKIILLLGDIIFMYSALFLALAIRTGDFSFLPGAHTSFLFIHFSVIYIFWLLMLFAFDFYEVSYIKNIFSFWKNLTIFLISASAFSIAYFYLQPELAIAPKTILFIYIVVFGFLFYGWRYFFSYILQLKNLKEKIIILGEQKEVKEIMPQILEKGYEIIGITTSITHLQPMLKKEKIDLVVLASDFYKNNQLVQQFFSILPPNLNYINFIDFYESLTQKAFIDEIDEIWFLENIFRKEGKINTILKRGFDIMFSFLGIFITIILFPVIALIIKLDSRGPVFYAQQRIGKNGRIFTLFKFRTMIVGAEKNGPQWTTENDSRITKFGKYLRASHLDEFPQFYNILKGDISFVGPRPERPEFATILQKQIPYYEIRHLVKPGLTGLAQIKYHYAASTHESKEKLRYELYYIKNQSFIFDIAILLKTVQIIFR